MIIYSIVPTEEILSLNRVEVREGTQIIKLDAIEAEVRSIEEGMYEIRRIFSTNPQDYLRPEFQPGARIKTQFHIDNSVRS